MSRSVHDLRLLLPNNRLHRQDRRQHRHRPRRRDRLVRHRRHGDRENHQQRHRRRRRSAATLYRFAELGSSFAAQAAPRFPEGAARGWRVEDCDFRREEEGPELLGCRGADVESSERGVCGDGWCEFEGYSVDGVDVELCGAGCWTELVVVCSLVPSREDYKLDAFDRGLRSFIRFV